MEEKRGLSTGKKFAIGCGAFLLLGVIVIVIAASVLWGQRGTLVSLETKIDAKYHANQSDYDKMWKTFVEMADVTELQAEQFKDVYTDLISGRYEDTELLFKAVQESNPQLDSSVYTQLQRQIAADRATFSNNQTALLDIIREYNQGVEHSYIIVALITNRKPYNMDDYIVTSERTDNAFESGKDEAIELNKKDNESNGN